MASDLGVQGRGIAEAPKVVGIVPARRRRLRTIAEARRSKINAFGIEYEEKIGSLVVTLLPEA